MKKISIIIPAYNAEKTLRKCYESILNQSYKNFEVITVNDASPDDTLSVMTEMSKKDSRFISVDMPKGGVSRARNYGLSKATGDYIQFVDADDTLKPDMLEKMVELIEKNDADLAICRFDHPFFKTYFENRIYDLTNPNDLIEICQDPFGLVMPWNKMWKRDKFLVPFDEEVSFSEDELCNLANLPGIKRVATTNEILYDYFIAPIDDPQLLNSCIGRLIKSVESGNDDSSFYWLGSKLLPKRRAFIENAIKENRLSISNADDIIYYKLIDYSIYTLSAYIGMNVSPMALIRDYLNIIDDANFKYGFKVQEKYGFKLREMPLTTKILLTEKFIDLCFKTYREKNNDEKFKISYAYMSIFLSLFAEQVGKLNPVNLNAKLIMDLKNFSTNEANYVKGILENDIILYNYSHIISNYYSY